MNITIAIFQSIINSLHYTLIHCLELYLNQRLEDEPSMVILVPRILPMIVMEFFITVMGCSMSSNLASVWNGCALQVYQSFISQQITAGSKNTSLSNSTQSCRQCRKSGLGGNLSISWVLYSSHFFEESLMQTHFRLKFNFRNLFYVACVKQRKERCFHFSKNVPSQSFFFCFLEQCPTIFRLWLIQYQPDHKF